MNKEGDGYNIFLTSDHHFGHDNIRGYCNRPFDSVWEMNNILTENWNIIVKPDDIIYYLGDFSFQSDKYKKYLNGRKFCLVRGNHDKRKYDYLFDEVVDSLELKIGEFNCLLTHIPIEIGRPYKKGMTPDFSLLDKYCYIICGHVHEAWKVSDKNVNVGVDVWDMKPLHINELARFLRSLKENEK
jgi:calcineurin-like phosphoesterase family protein